MKKSILFLFVVFFLEGGIKETEQGFEQRWQTCSEMGFPEWTSEWTEEILRERFEKMSKDRWSIYFTNHEEYGKKGVFGSWKEEFRMPENRKLWNSRYPYPIAPVYSLAVPYYNASLISLSGMHFLAMEAPCEKNLDAFFSLLDEYKVTDLVRLTPQVYKGREGSFPYWEGRMDVNPVSGGVCLEGQGRNYFPMDCWEDHQGIDPERLVALVRSVQRSSISDKKMVAVHCRAGVGRTGTFIAAYALLTEVDRQVAAGGDIHVSVDKVVWELCIQRPFAVTHFPQYKALYEMVKYLCE